MTQFCPDPPPKCEISHFFFFSSENFPNKCEKNALENIVLDGKMEECL